MSRIEYACFKYYNSIISEECMYLGVLIHNLETNERFFKHIKNFKRLETFDDEINISFVKLYLEGIKEETEINLFNNTEFNLKDYIINYVNEFRFTDVKYYNSEDDEDYVSHLYKLYLKYDLSKNQRLNSNEEKKLIKKVLKENFNCVSTESIIGSYKENIDFDYILGSIAIKYFDFKEKNLTKVIPSVKTWAFTAHEMQHKYKIIFLCDFDKLSNKNEMITNYETIKNILQHNALVYEMENGLESIIDLINRYKDIPQNRINAI